MNKLQQRTENLDKHLYNTLKVLAAPMPTVLLAEVWLVQLKAHNF